MLSIYFVIMLYPLLLQALRIPKKVYTGSRFFSTTVSTKIEPSTMISNQAIMNIFRKSTLGLKGVGAKYAALLQKLDINTVGDLLFYFPKDVIVRQEAALISQIQSGSVVTLKLKVIKVVDSIFSKGKMFTIICSDENGDNIKLLYFSATYLISLYKSHAISKTPILVSGKVTLNPKTNELVICYPDKVASSDDSILSTDFFSPEPVYGLTEGLSSARIRTYANEAIKLCQNVELVDWIPRNVLLHKGWPRFLEALTSIHNPVDKMSVSPQSPALTRLAYDELVALCIEATKQSRDKDFSIQPTSGLLTSAFIDSLPFALTSCQVRAFDEVLSDLRSRDRMERMLQGDVGSGKTVVAFLGLLSAVEGRKQGVCG
jgi:ATP-dependent DNA helicase RecG